MSTGYTYGLQPPRLKIELVLCYFAAVSSPSLTAVGRTLESDNLVAAPQIFSSDSCISLHLFFYISCTFIHKSIPSRLVP
jgi:hypothetical protein